ncbi:MAG: hypothetical protein V3569_00985 [Acholeplasmataceae bacterium]
MIKANQDKFKTILDYFIEEKTLDKAKCLLDGKPYDETYYF